MKSLKQLLSKVKSGKMDKKTAKDLDKLVTRGDGFVVITKSKKNGYNRFHANQVDDRGIDIVPHMRDFKPKKGVYKPEHAMTDINWKDVKDIYMENKMNLEELVGKPITEAQFDEAAGEKDACYHKVKARYDVWPSAYASGALVKCRKVGAKNWGNSKKEGVNEVSVGVNVHYFYKKANKNKNKFFKMLSDFRKKHSDIKWIKMLDYALEDFNENPKKYKTIDDKQNILFKNLQNNKKVNEADVVESYDLWAEDGSFGYTMTGLIEAEYQGRKVKLGKPMQGDVKKFKVYVKNPAGNVVKVNFGQGGDAKGGTMRIRKSNPKARKAFRARHNCDSPGPRHKARYWSCRKW